jgi:hypothetical protein
MENWLNRNVRMRLESIVGNLDCAIRPEIHAKVGQTANPCIPALAAGHAHVPFQRRLLVPPINHKIMAFRLPRDRLIDRGV